MIHFRILGRGLFGLVLFLTIAGAAHAQTSLISGIVTDPAGNAISGAAITITNTLNGAARTATSSSDGTYSFRQLQPGIYRVRAEARGFKTTILDDVQLMVSTPLTLNIPFREVGAVSDAVTVTGGETTINTTDATLGNTFNSTQVKDLPLAARNVVGLLSLQPGVTPAGYVNGGRSDQANVTLDGVDVNEQQTGDAFFSVLRTTPDALQEFRVVTTNPNADQGRSSGAQISLVTKSGTNEYHGSLYEYHRNTVTSANNWFNNKAGVPREALLRNNFGGAIGGPIKKDKLFFFFNYEGFRESRGATAVREVPLLSTIGSGNVTYVAADPAAANTAPCPIPTNSGRRCVTLNPAQINAAYTAVNGVSPGINPAAVLALGGAARKYVANDTTTGDGLNTSGFRFNASTPASFDTYIAKVDYNISSNQTLFVRGNYQDDLVTRVRWLPDTFAPATWTHPKGIAAGHTWSATNNFVNNFRYGFTRDAFTSLGDSAENSVNFRFIFQPLAFSRISCASDASTQHHR